MSNQVIPNFLSIVDFFSASFAQENLEMLPSEFIKILGKSFQMCGLQDFLFESCLGGLFGYKNRMNILREDRFSGQSIQSGLIAYTDMQGISNSRNTSGFYFSLSGMGCRKVDFVKLVKLLSKYKLRITRIDIASDYYDGLVNFELVKELYYEKAFVNRGRSPRCSENVSEIICPKTGFKSQIGARTFYVGKRGGAKFGRFYDKGMQLFALNEEHPFPDWFRCEVEFRNVQCEIPLEIVANLDGALFGAYPNFFSKIPPPNHIDLKKESSQIIKMKYETPEDQVNLEHFIYWCRESYGGLFNVLLNEIGLESDAIVDLLLPDDGTKKPRRLLFPTVSTPTIAMIH